MINTVLTEKSPPMYVFLTTAHPWCAGDHSDRQSDGLNHQSEKTVLPFPRREYVAGRNRGETVAVSRCAYEIDDPTCTSEISTPAIEIQHGKYDPIILVECEA